MSAPMAMFPLGAVLLPGAILPLQVFERRYLDMVHDCLREDEPEFGQVLILRGSEAGGGDERSMVGTVARMVQIEALDEQRYRFLAVGTRRIVVDRWLPDDPYPRAEVTDWPDVDPERLVADSLGRMEDRVRSTLALAGTLAGSVERVGDFDIADDAVAGSYHLCALAPIGPADRYRLLASPGPAERLDLLSEILDDVDAMLKFRLS